MNRIERERMMDRLEMERMNGLMRIADAWGITLSRAIRNQIEYMHEAGKELHPYSRY